jgi:hypothetical protein
MGVLVVDTPDAYRIWVKAVAPDTPGLAAKSKFIAVLAFDPFGKTWKISAYDIADQDSEFRTDNANRYVRALGAVKAKNEP